MAIVENISSEIGDVIRIKTTVPIAGIISLFGFDDVTLGEKFEENAEAPVPGPDPIPSVRDESPYPLPDKGTKISAAVNSIRIDGNMGYALSFANSGIREYRTIVSINLDTRIGDRNYPDAKFRLAGLIIANGFAYSCYNTEGIPGVARLDLSLKTWTYYTSSTLQGSLATKGVVDKLCNNKIYFFRRTGLGQELTSFNVLTYTFAEVSLPPDSDISVRPRSIYGATISCNLNRIYFQADIYDGVGEGNFIQYDINTDTWELLRPAAGITWHEASYNEFTNLIYYYTRELPGGSTVKAQMYSYDPVTREKRTDYPLSPQTKMQYELYVIGGRGYSFSPEFFYTYDVNNEEWILTKPDQPDPPDPINPQNRFFEKTFRYSIDAGMTFSDWMPLEELSLDSLPISQKDQFVLDVAYKRSGNDTTGNLQWDSFTIDGIFENLDYPIYKETIFNKLFPVNDPIVLGWALNVLEKLHEKGLLPDYVVRNTNKPDVDFVSYFYSVTHLFALIVYLARNFEDIPSKKLVLIEFLKNFDIVLPFDENLTDLGDIYSNRVREYRLRGTNEINRINGVDGATLDGELIRLVNKQEKDFYLFGHLEPQEIGWCIGESSPTWTGTENISNLVIAYESTKSVLDLNKYPLLNPTSIVIATDTIANEEVMDIFSVSDDTGIGYSDIDNPDQNFLVLIDPQIDYEISFKIRKGAAGDDYLKFGAVGYDDAFNKIDLSPIDGSGLFLNSFIGSAATNILPLVDVFYNLKGVLYNYNEANSASKKLNFLDGRGLKLTQNVKYIGFYIYVGASFAADEAAIYDIKFRPLNLPISQGLLGIKNIIALYAKNNGDLVNGVNDSPGPNDPQYVEARDALRTFIQTKLIPYNSFVIPKYL